MKTKNPFDQKLRDLGNDVPSHVRSGMIYLADTLDISQAVAKSIFEDDATPEITLAIYDRFIEMVKLRSESTDFNAIIKNSLRDT